MDTMIQLLGQSGTVAILLGGFGVLVVCAIVQLHKISRLNRQMGKILKSVENYLTAVMEEEKEEEGQAQSITAPERMNRTATGRKEGKRNPQEEQSSLVSTVLQEFFP